MLSDSRQLHEAIVLAVDASLSTCEWERVVINYEMEYSDDGPAANMLGFAVVRGANGQLAKQEVELTSELEEGFVQLNDWSLSNNGERWGSCEVTIDSTGKFDFQFSFEKPKRLNGVFDQESYYRFGDYLKTYVSPELPVTSSGIKTRKPKKPWWKVW